jgi:hypothetical protein
MGNGGPTCNPVRVGRTLGTDGTPHRPRPPQRRLRVRGVGLRGPQITTAHHPRNCTAGNQHPQQARHDQRNNIPRTSVKSTARRRPGQLVLPHGSPPHQPPSPSSRPRSAPERPLARALTRVGCQVDQRAQEWPERVPRFSSARNEGQGQRGDSWGLQSTRGVTVQTW